MTLHNKCTISCSCTISFPHSLLQKWHIDNDITSDVATPHTDLTSTQVYKAMDKQECNLNSLTLAVHTDFSLGKLAFWYFQHRRHWLATQQCQYAQALTLNCVTSSSTLVQKSTTNTATFLLRNWEDCQMRSGITSAFFCYQAAVTPSRTTLKNSRSNAQESSDCPG